jgi:hypothetical protein
MTRGIIVRGKTDGGFIMPKETRVRDEGTIAVIWQDII